VNRAALEAQINLKKSVLTVGLDTDVEKIPSHFPKNKEGILAFNKAIIDATKDLAVAYKINTAFYEVYGKEGWEMIEKTREYIPSDCFTIADAKRGDIGNTSTMYAKAFFESLDFDSVTVAPYMGRDSVAPFLAFENKITIVLGLTSNAGSADFQLESAEKPLYKEVIKKVSTWGNEYQLMFVVGATNAEKLQEIRDLIPNHFLLIPGVGAQGGSLSDVMKYGFIPGGGLLINSSRGIIFASSDKDFEGQARKAAEEMVQEMQPYFKE
jgi:orotidine-5'-phosphate decarboxylase